MNDLFSDSINQLNKLSIRKMNYRITQINIDFEDVMSTTWQACDADDLVEEITSATGFCVNSIDYCYVLK